MNVSDSDHDFSTIQQLLLDLRGRFSGMAIVCNGREVSYAAFDNVTDRLAFALQERGIGPGSFVALRIPRSEKMAEAAFGILKAGAALIPMNADIPEERAGSLCRACGVSLIMDEACFGDLLDSKPFCGSSPAGLRLARETDPAMVIATSGTTGRPKGVCQSQRSIRFLMEQFPSGLGDIGIIPRDYEAVLGHLQQGFIVSWHYDLSIALLNGRKLLLLTENEQLSIPAFCQAMESVESCFLGMLPSQLNLFLEDARFCRLAAKVTCLQVFSEPVTDSLMQKILRIFPDDTTLTNLYGQSETAGMGWHDLRDGSSGFLVSPGVTLRILDEDGLEVPPGELGQICAHAPTLFDRYYIEGNDGADEEEGLRQFAAKNIEVGGERYVKTGDLGVKTADGRFLLRGRSDRMVKFHGQRIELAEIESVLLDCPGIQAAAALLARGRDGKQVLAGFYVTGGAEAPSPHDLWKHLRSSLNAFMIPGLLQAVEALPTGSNGKIDYRALEQLALEAAERAGGTAPAEPLVLSPEEELLRRLAADIMKLPEAEVSLERSFLSQGMDSLSAVLLISALAGAGYSLTLSDFLNAPSARELAGKLRKKETEAGMDSKTSPVYPATDMQERWIRKQFQISRAWKIPFGMEEADLRAYAERTLRRHPALRAAFFPDGEQYKTRVLAAKRADCEYRDLRGVAPAERFRAVKTCLENLFGCPRPGNLFFPTALRVGESETIVILTMNHCGVDAMSEQILLSELLEPGTSARGTDAFLSWLKACHEPEYRERARGFWKGYLRDAFPASIPAPGSGSPQTGVLKTFGPAGPSVLYPSSVPVNAYNICLTEAQTSALEKRCREAEYTVSSVVMHAYGEALSRFLNLENIFFACVFSGRTVPVGGMQDTVGCLVSSLPACYRRGETIPEFFRGMMQADLYSALPLRDILQAAFGTARLPAMAPEIDSLLMPRREGTGRAEPVFALDYARMPEGSFLWKADGRLHLTLRFPAAEYEQGFTDALAARMVETITAAANGAPFTMA